jgi:hypothetical protein
LEDLKVEFESLLSPLEDKNVISYISLKSCRERDSESVISISNRFIYIVLLTNIDPTIQYCVFKSNLSNIKDKLDEESFNSNIIAILTIVRKIKSKLIKSSYLTHNLRTRTFERKALTAEDKDKFMKVGICFYCREKGYIIIDYNKNLGKVIV